MLAPRWLRQADSFAGLTKPSPSIQLWSINGFSLSRVLEEFDNSSAAWSPSNGVLWGWVEKGLVGIGNK